MACCTSAASSAEASLALAGGDAALEVLESTSTDVATPTSLREAGRDADIALRSASVAAEVAVAAAAAGAD